MSKKKPKSEEPKKFDEEVALELGWAYDTTTQIVDTLKELEHALKGRLPGREFSIALTKLEEAEMWISRGFEMAGYEEIPVPEEEGEEEEVDEEATTEDGEQDA